MTTQPRPYGEPAPGPGPRVRPRATGLRILGLLALVDVLAPIILPAPAAATPGPPPWISALTTLLGLVGLILVALIVRGEGRAALLGLVGTRALSAATALPAFVVPGVPWWAVTFAAVFVLLTVIGCGQLAPALRHPAG